MIVHYYANNNQKALSACGLVNESGWPMLKGWATGNRLRVSCPVCIAAMEGC